jgi:hypothetical protein
VTVASEAWQIMSEALAPIGFVTFHVSEEKRPACVRYEVRHRDGWAVVQRFAHAELHTQLNPAKVISWRMVDACRAAYRETLN